MLDAMNEHAKIVYYMTTKGHKKELGVNARWYHKVVVYGLLMIDLLTILIVFFSIILWPFIDKVFDWLDDVEEAYKYHLFKKGIGYSKDYVWLHGDLQDYQNNFVVTDVFEQRVQGRNAVNLALASIGNSDGDFSWNMLGLDRGNIEKELGIKLADRPYMDVKYESNTKDSEDDSMLVKVKHTYVDPRYFETEFGNKLLENFSYNYTDYSYLWYGEPRDEDNSLINRIYGGRAVERYVSRVDVEVIL